MPFIKIAIATTAILAACATSASADVRYTGSSKFGMRVIEKDSLTSNPKLESSPPTPARGNQAFRA